MKKVQLGLFGAMVVISLCAKADDSRDIKRVMLKAAEEQKAYEVLGLPIKDASYRTIGDLCKGSHLIVVGRVEAAQARDVLDPWFQSIMEPTTDLTIRVSETLKGPFQGGTVSFTFGYPHYRHTIFPRVPPVRSPGKDPRIYMPEKPPTHETWVGMEIVAFLKPLSPHNSKNLEKLITMKITTVWLEPTWERGSVFVFTDDTREEMLNRVRDYARWQSSKDTDAYKTFLAEQMKSPDWRISGEALWDMIDFMRSHYTDKEELKKASQDPLLDKRVKGYFDFHLNRDTKQADVSPERPENRKLPPSAELSPEEQEKRSFQHKLLGYPGLYSAWTRKLFTLSNYSKHSAWVAIGIVVEEPEAWEKQRPAMYSMVFSPDAYLYGGKLLQERFRLHIYVREDGNADGIYYETDRRVPKPGDKLLVFLRNETNGEVRLSAEFRSYIFLDDKETEEAVTNAVNKYIHIFNDGGKHDKDGYHEFLCSLLQSPVQRIRDDAENDLLLFYVNEASLDLEKALADDRVRKEIKDYLRYLIRNEKPKSE